MISVVVFYFSLQNPNMLLCSSDILIVNVKTHALCVESILCMLTLSVRDSIHSAACSVRNLPPAHERTVLHPTACACAVQTGQLRHPSNLVENARFFSLSHKGRRRFCGYFPYIHRFTYQTMELTGGGKKLNGLSVTASVLLVLYSVVARGRSAPV